MKYKINDRIVDVIQYNGNNIHDIEKLCGDKISYSEIWEEYEIINDPNDYTTHYLFTIYNYVIKDENTVFAIANEEIFKRYFIKI